MGTGRRVLRFGRGRPVGNSYGQQELFHETGGDTFETREIDKRSRTDSRLGREGRRTQKSVRRNKATARPEPEGS